jgi:hypothetical protein
LVQPSLGVARRPSSEATHIGSSSDHHRPVMAQKVLVRALLRDFLRDRGHVLTSAVARARGGRAFRLERRDLSCATPPWMLLSNRALHADAHLPPVLPLTTRDARGQTVNQKGKRTRRYK